MYRFLPMALVLAGCAVQIPHLTIPVTQHISTINHVQVVTVPDIQPTATVDAPPVIMPALEAPSAVRGPVLMVTGFTAHATIDYGGDGSQEALVKVIQPGDSVGVRPVLANVGDVTSAAPVLDASCADPLASVSLCYGHDPLTYADLAPGANEEPWHAGGGFCLSVSRNWPHGHPIRVDLAVTDAHAHTWSLVLSIPVL